MGGGGYCRGAAPSQPARALLAGTLVFPDGAKYVGCFEQGKLCGKGELPQTLIVA